MKKAVRNKELSWLSFNARLLQEAADPSVPLIERMKFLGIFSSNQDEFFRVRVATLKRLVSLGKKARALIGGDPQEILQEIYRTVVSQQGDFNRIYQQLLRELKRENIFLINEKQLNQAQSDFLDSYFRREVRENLIPIMIDQLEEFPEVKDHSIYLAIAMYQTESSDKTKYSLIEIPTDVVPRFLILPTQRQRKYVILLDDIIRHNLRDIFYMFDPDRFEAYTIKVTRDAELDIDNDLSESFIRKMTKSLKQRKTGAPVRFVYDEEMPDEMLDFLIKKCKLDKKNDNFIPGGRYHNFKDFISFPSIGDKHTVNERILPLPHRHINPRKSLLKTFQKQDILVHYPYQTFGYVIDFLREAAIDPKVVSIKITLYRVAKKSKVIKALVNAVKNGKEVTVIMELQARFDEEANIYWANRLREEGVRVIHGVPGLKVHSKLILVTRQAKNKMVQYANIGTGNFNESTAKIYSDHGLFTCDKRLTREVSKVFDFIENNYKRVSFSHLLVAPFNMRQKFTKMINNEIKNAAKGEDAYIIVKLNNLTDTSIIEKLYRASQAGVPVKLMVRGMFSAVTETKGISENIAATGIIDKYLEHTRLFVFCAGGHEKYFLSSADWMPRNLDRRVEVACPIYDPQIQKEIRDFLDIQWQDNVKARVLDPKLINTYKKTENGRERIRAQVKLYEYFKDMLDEEEITRSQSIGEEFAVEEKPDEKPKPLPLTSTNTEIEDPRPVTQLLSPKKSDS